MGSGVYLTWVVSAMALGVLLMPFLKPPWQKINMVGFIDFIRRYWAHIALVFSIYVWKDILDKLDRLIMANTGIEATPWIYAIEGDMVLWVQQLFQSDLLTTVLTHFYVLGYMLVCYISVLYFAYFDDRWMSDRSSLAIFYVYALAVPFYLFFNVRVTGDHIPEMATLAYDLTPEINDWFTRIDPFTNGMPSLHIGIPFAVWLSLVKWDKDRRWARYRLFIAGYIWITGFTIIYLGIHWFLDIIGGIVVAYIAVSLSEKSQIIWKVLDERTFNSRLVILFTSRERTYKWIKQGMKNVKNSLSSPTSKETGIAIFVVLILTSTIIVWDVTHQELPAGGVDSPLQTTAADGWLVSLDNRTEGVTLVVTELANPTIEIIPPQPLLDKNSTFDTAWDYVAMANESNVWIIDLTNLNAEPWILPADNATSIRLAEWPGYGVVVLLIENNILRGMTLDGDEVPLPQAPSNSELLILSVHENKLALSYSDNPAIIRLGQIGRTSLFDQPLNYQAAEEENDVLLSWGQTVDEENAYIVDIDMDHEWLVATVNVTAVDRLVLVDLQRGESHLLTDAKYPVHDPTVGFGLVVWASQDNLIPSSPSPSYLDHEICFYDLLSSAKKVQCLTDDDDEQRNPSVLDDHITWVTTDEDGQSTTTIHSRQVILDTYSSKSLQIATLLTIALLIIYSRQKMQQGATSIMLEEE